MAQVTRRRGAAAALALLATAAASAGQPAAASERASEDLAALLPMPVTESALATSRGARAVLTLPEEEARLRLGVVLFDEAGPPPRPPQPRNGTGGISASPGAATVRSSLAAAP